MDINILSIFVSTCFSKVVDFFISKWNIIIKKTTYSGKWEGQIFNEENKPITTDEFDLIQIGNKITGKAKRISPKEQNSRRYEIYGKLFGANFVAIFWATDQTVLSYGCWFLTQTNNEPTTFEGYYLKLGKNLRATKSIKGKLTKQT